MLSEEALVNAAHKRISLAESLRFPILSADCDRPRSQPSTFSIPQSIWHDHSIREAKASTLRTCLSPPRREESKICVRFRSAITSVPDFGPRVRPSPVAATSLLRPGRDGERDGCDDTTYDR